MTHSDTLKACAYSLGVDINHLALVLPIMRQMKEDKANEWTDEDAIERTISINFHSITLICSKPNPLPSWLNKT